jgi:hypothetical protein
LKLSNLAGLRKMRPFALSIDDLFVLHKLEHAGTFAWDGQSSRTVGGVDTRACARDAIAFRE